MGEPEARYQVELSSEDWLIGSFGAKRLSAEWLSTVNRRAFRPPFDVYETDRQIVVKAEIAGMREEEFSVSLDGRILHISGTRQDATGKLAYQRMEINYGEFQLDIHLPPDVDEGGVEASYDRGFLTVCVPRRTRETKVPITRHDGS